MYKLADISAFERLGAQNSVSGAVFNAEPSEGRVTLEQIAESCADGVLERFPNRSEAQLRRCLVDTADICYEMLCETHPDMDEAMKRKESQRFHKMVLDALSKKYNEKMTRAVGKKITDHFKD